MLAIVFISLTGQTRRFVEKLSADQQLEIDDRNCDVTMKQPFLLIVPTYQEIVRELVDDFLAVEGNLEKCRGIVGAGNLNFAQLFCFTAKDISRDYRIPLIHQIEFQGNETDVSYIKEVMRNG
ncbi:class Ib ribonucleoside-diphosphate reductase assembly flavoprotein NrdI [Facklamia miroungae]|uniref:Protein involved in ribonucleotide reduction n=1 Tax=Facklamia miroungae TaxID=120956 RepID=A0A1G7QPC5_9LACT|nr:class Ib ribonucleoside-diphosphate reductase assembly flavoprotein NrdI [Facklamia miroungae]NKZ29018.1 class Ib ribonucleoside-diphosphate reductase assembly flavoprotein NrdI [Facklamia miroungae]SDG00397.1 protein involved in ribonucleotide reduction [Facklamia miroungae]